MKLQRISLTELTPPEHPVRARIDDEGIEELALDIKRAGVKCPLLVKPANGHYEVIYGHRRFLAATRAQLAAVPCLVWEPADGDPLLFKLHENLHRQDLNPVEEAVFYAELYEQMEHDVDRVCASTHQNRSYVEGRLSLLSGNPAVMDSLSRGAISLGVANSLNKCQREDHCVYLLDWAVRQGATVAVVAGWVAQYNARADFEATSPPVDVEQKPLEQVKAEPFRCFLCGSEEDPWEFEFHHIHRSCVRSLRRAEKQREAGSGQ